jgi:hypothetical protein
MGSLAKDVSDILAAVEAIRKANAELKDIKSNVERNVAEHQMLRDAQQQAQSNYEKACRDLSVIVEPDQSLHDF